MVEQLIAIFCDIEALEFYRNVKYRIRPLLPEFSNDC